MSNEVSNSSLKNNLHQVTYQDLIIFKEDLLKEFRNYRTKISDNINLEFEKYSGLLEKSNQNLNYYEKDKSFFMSKIDFVQEKEKLFTEVINKTNELKNEVMVNQLHISNCRKDIDNSCYKYDKAIADNLLVPGIIGKSCKFQNLKEYIIYNKEEMNNAFFGNRQNATELNMLKKKVEANTGQLNTKIKSLEYRLSNFIATRYHELDDKFDRLYEELNKRMNSLLREVNSNIEERKNELARLKNFVFEENTKNIESVKGIKNDITNELGDIKKKFKKIKKNIVSLTNLLMGRTQNMNKQLVITNFNNMMLELFREMSLEEGFEFKKIDKIDNILPTKTFKKSVKPSGESCIKQYIEGKITINDAKFHSEKAAIKRKKSFQLNDKMLIGLNKEEAQQTMAANNYNSNNNTNIKIESPKVNKKFKSRLSQVITVNPNILENKIKGFTEPKKEEKINSNKDISSFKIESFNNAIINKNKSRTNYSKVNKKADNNGVINEEDSNKYNSSKSNNNSFEIKNENRKSSYNIVKQKELNLTPTSKIGKKNKFLKAENNNFNIYSNKKNNQIIEFSENSSSSLKLENSTEIKNNNSPNKSKPKTAYKKSMSKTHKDSDDLAYNSEYKSNALISQNNNNINDNISKNIQNIKIKNKEEENKSLTNKNIQDIENEKSNEYDSNLDKNNDIIQKNEKIKIFKNEQKDKVSNENKEEVKQSISSYQDNKKNKLKLVLKSENIENFNIIDQKNSNKSIPINFRNSLTQLISKEMDDKISSFKKSKMGSKLNLKKCSESTKIKDTIMNNDNNVNNMMSKTKYGRFQSTSDKAVTTIPRINSPNVIRSQKSREDDKLIISSNGGTLINSKYPNNAPKALLKEITRNHILNNIEERAQLTSFEKQKIILNKNKYFINNEIRQKIKSGSKSKQSKLKVSEDIDDIYLSKDYIKSTRYVKDEDIIDKPLLLDMNVFNIEKKKGNLENRLSELEYFTKKKLDELVKEIKIFIPIHFNSYIKNYSVNKNN